ncbi:FlaD/FlaE family flagellar protein [Methanogenium organophilum]|uniref:Archaeal flagella protein FlaD/E domain-containing protein n=1 Tax=Methanogenium organophilum TaxID=2199 RepID=A0A9X9T831_METOG|nr:FlaD/FlaE family flagellar protein [Methanogenium organophilum]WAI01046.1 hypothetical protein OU421_11585 [Methanogenium organophilum]
MAINQSQVDHIINSASADDPEVKLQNLQDEVDLLKKSIKKLLIDIRERMNELENPFIVASMQQELPRSVSSPEVPTDDLQEEVQIPEQTTMQPSPAEESGTQSVHEPLNTGSLQQPASLVSERSPSPEFSQLSKDESLLLSLHQKMEELSPAEKNAAPEKVRLQKLHRLFEWTNKMVKKYGHDRLEIMIESYRTMGYISEDSYQQVNDIARLMPESLGESHEISSDEFVSELYVLNRILSPRDSSLDRDMIEVLMDMRAGQVSPEETPGKTKNKMAKDEWIDMLDRI